MKQIFFGKTVNGVPKISRRNEMQEALLAFEGKEFQITIEKKKKSRSLNQNSYWWGVVIPMVREGLKELGMKLSKEETHELLKAKFLQKEIINENTGEIFKYVAGSSELTTSGFMDFIAEVQQFASEYLSINIPAPNEQVNIEFEQ